MSKLITFIIAISAGFVVYSQDTTAVFKSGYAGGYLVVPQDQSWNLDRVFVNDGEAYNIQISNSNFEKNYLPGDTIRLPYYVAEMELLSKQSMVNYQLYFRSTAQKKE